MTNFTHWTYHVDEQNIGWLELDVAGSSVNILRREVMAEWAEVMTHIAQGQDTGRFMFSLWKRTWLCLWGGYP